MLILRTHEGATQSSRWPWRSVGEGRGLWRIWRGFLSAPPFGSNGRWPRRSPTRDAMWPRPFCARGEGQPEVPMYEESAQLTAEWAREMAIADEQLSPALSLSPDRSGGADERAHKQIAEIDAGITEIDQRLKVASRHIFALARPDPLSIEDWIQLLHPDEALVLVLTGHGEETFVGVHARCGARQPLARHGATLSEADQMEGVLAEEFGPDVSAQRTASGRGRDRIELASDVSACVPCCGWERCHILQWHTAKVPRNSHYIGKRTRRI